MDRLDQIIKALQQSWAADTSYDANEWSLNNPARGQCVVSSLVIQDYFGGDICRYRAIFRGQRESHFFNTLADGKKVDTTRSQYPAHIELTPAPLVLGGLRSVRDKLLSDTDAVRRYQLLSMRVCEALPKNF